MQWWRITTVLPVQDQFFFLNLLGNPIYLSWSRQNWQLEFTSFRSRDSHCDPGLANQHFYYPRHTLFLGQTQKSCGLSDSQCTNFVGNIESRFLSIGFGRLLPSYTMLVCEWSWYQGKMVPRKRERERESERASFLIISLLASRKSSINSSLLYAWIFKAISQ